MEGKRQAQAKKAAQQEAAMKKSRAKATLFTEKELAKLHQSPHLQERQTRIYELDRIKRRLRKKFGDELKGLTLAKLQILDARFEIYMKRIDHWVTQRARKQQKKG